MYIMVCCAHAILGMQAKVMAQKSVSPTHGGVRQKQRGILFKLAVVVLACYTSQ